MAILRTATILQSLPVGFRFHPTDDELVNHYLKQKMMGNDHLVREIAEVNIYKFEPWDLPESAEIQSGDDKEWYFFCPRILKYSNSQRVKRTTRAGYWKVTGKGRKIRNTSTKEVIATIKNLVFHVGRFPNGIETNGVMHEYLPSFNLPKLQKGFVICKLIKNMDGMPTLEEGESSAAGVVASDFGNQLLDKNEESESAHDLIPSHSDNQNPNDYIGTPISGEDEFSPVMASDFEYQSSCENNVTPTCEGEFSPLIASDCISSEVWSSMTY